MSVGTVVNYGGLAFNSGIADGNGTQWYVDKLEGWDSPATRLASSTPTTRHGQVYARNLLDARAVVLGGLVKALNLSAFYTAYYGFQAAFNNLVTPKSLTVTEDIDRYVGACRTGNIKKDLQGQCAFKFEVNLTCPDPLKYPTSDSTATIAAGASATLNNVGSFPTERIRITTGAGAVSVVNETVGGNGLFTDADVEAGSVLDAQTRTFVDSAGNTLFSALAPTSQWFTLQPGANTVTNHSDASVTIAYRSAWE